MPYAARGPPAAGNDLLTKSLPDKQAATAEQDLQAAERHAAIFLPDRAARIFPGSWSLI
jgi:hypothetical protein